MLNDSERTYILRENTAHNTEQVISSPILAKAVIRKPDGRVQIVTVFTRSTRNEFYWVFEANTPRSPRRKWRTVKSFAVRLQIGPEPIYNDFASFLAYYIMPVKQVLSNRVLKAGALRSVTAKQEHESIRFDWDRVVNQAGARFDKMNRKFHSKMKEAGGRWDEGWVFKPAVETGD